MTHALLPCSFFSYWEVKIHSMTHTPPASPLIHLHCLLIHLMHFLLLLLIHSHWEVATRLMTHALLPCCHSFFSLGVGDTFGTHALLPATLLVLPSLTLGGQSNTDADAPPPFSPPLVSHRRGFRAIHSIIACRALRCANCTHRCTHNAAVLMLYQLSQSYKAVPKLYLLSAQFLFCTPELCSYCNKAVPFVVNALKPVL
jgi:hypothetical protein